jgi:hypothetical protein
MCSLENKVLPKMTKPPILYARYVDDIFLLIDNISILHDLKSNFEAQSVLKFTFEIEKLKSLPFLDVLIERTKDHTLKTSIYTKTTNTGECMNYNSITTEQYKLAVIRTFLHRAYRICSSWELLHSEMQRIKQLLTNNNYPITVIEKEIHNFLQRKLNEKDISSKPELIKLYYKNQFNSNYKHEEKQLRKIIENNVKPTSSTGEVKLLIYYQARKLKNLFIKNNPHGSSSISSVVYRYTCDHEGCQPTQTYIGYTISTLVERMRNHAQHGSILNHNKTQHNKKITTQEIVSNTKVIKKLPTKTDLLIAEALLIKEHNPTLNAQREGETRILSIF